ncbi:MAG: acylneuraminate cytidylyltransferase family protein [Candidatus Scalindua sp.]|jgi:CMP-N,N'-diacetyllegionaminic acid synthase|nr:acylneuraminate cytidylyltransferase family protein [Candidatus Scalindua sp.]MBT6226420.1 acylneuraminate cytidylyltransferase family protein [Candidatus Scalindua sp.]
MKVDSIILARGGSKGIPGKNIIDFCGKPLLAWSIEQCCTAKSVTGIWVSSNSDEILDVAREYGANTIRRPDEISGDLATSESGWLHAIKMIELESGQIDLVLAPQVTSPLREPEDIERGIRTFIEGGYDSMFSCSVAEDLFFWERDSEGVLRSVNYDYLNRQRRQDVSKQFIENGSFYLFRPELLRRHNNRFGGNIGCVEMDSWKMFEIDISEDIRICSALMKEFLL